MADKSGGWKTINGVHVFIDGKGTITKGPAKFIGSKPSDLPSGKTNQADLKARLQAKKDAKSGEKKFITERDNSVKDFKAKQSTTKPKATPEKREATSTDVLGYNGSDPYGVYHLEQMKGKLEAKKRLTQADKDKLNMINKELSDSPYSDFSLSKVSAKTTADKALKSAPKSQAKTNNADFDNAVSKATNKTSYADQLAGGKAKAVSTANIEAELKAQVSRGGQEVFKNAQGDAVTVSYSRYEGLKAEIRHSNGSMSIVYGDRKKIRGGYDIDTEGFAKKINDPANSYNAPKPNTGNPLFDNAVKKK